MTFSLLDSTVAQHMRQRYGCDMTLIYHLVRWLSVFVVLRRTILPVVQAHCSILSKACVSFLMPNRTSRNAPWKKGLALLFARLAGVYCSSA